MPVLRTNALTKSYNGRTVVRGVSLEVSAGEVVGLLGPNGAGKTTTFYMVVGLTPPDEGRVLLGDEDITGLPMYLRARMYIGSSVTSSSSRMTRPESGTVSPTVM